MQFTPATGHFIEAFSWMLIHSLWEGMLMALFAGAFLYASRKASSALRYRLIGSQLILFVVSCVLTFAWEWNNGSKTFSMAGTMPLESFGYRCSQYFSANAPLIVLLWFLCFTYRSLRLMGGLLYLNRARYRDVYQPPVLWIRKIDYLARQLQLTKAVQLLESGFVKVPMVIGHLKPVILVPVGLLAGLPPAQLEAVLLHELAHIRRSDYLVNCLQSILETIFFFNPGLLWISSVLREEREHCCDDLALAQTNDKKAFVQALVSFKEFSLVHYAVAFPGNRGSLLNRASRILYQQNKKFGRSEKAFFAGGLLILVAVLTLAFTTHIIKPAIKVEKEMVSIVHPMTVLAVFSKRRLTQNLPHAALRRKSAKPVLKNQKQVSAVPPDPENVQATDKQQQYGREQMQALTDQQRALRDQAQALLDQQQATRDQQQALRDQAQAVKYRQNSP